ncbi:hypothetical protein R6Q57_028400 [Mikania cordata]
MDATRNPNLIEATRNGRHTIPLTSSQAFKRTHEQICMKKLEKPSDDEHVVIGETEASFLAAGEGGRSATSPPSEQPGKMVEESGREKLKRHRVEMSGRVWIPDIWGQEDLLKKWIDCTVFDSALERSSIMSAREALIQEGRSTLSI